MILQIYTALMWVLAFFIPLLKKLPHDKLAYFFNFQGTLFKQCTDPKKLSIKPLWIHASSGEIEYAKPVILWLKTWHPEIPILVTHSSLSSRQTLEKLEVDLLGVIPFDSPTLVKQFISLVQPCGLLLARTDIWPNTVRELHNQNIPVVLFSATFSEGSKKTQALSVALLKSILPLIKGLYFVSSEDEKMAQASFPKIQGKVIGDTRYDQVLARLKTTASNLIPPHPTIFIAGSTWPEDDRVLLPVFQDLINKKWKGLWVPHEVSPQHISYLKSTIEKQNLRVSLFSEGVSDQLWKQTDILLIDQVGLLASLYKSAHLAFIGGSFRKQVHSVMEALAAGLPVVVGPYYKNNREAQEFAELGAVKSVSNSQEMLKALQDLHQSYTPIQSLLREEIQKRLGTTERLVHELKDLGLLSRIPKI